MDVAQWRSSIGRFTQQTTRRRAGHRRGYKMNDPRLLVLLFILMASFGSIHPNPGPNGADFQTSEERQLFNSLRGKESKILRMESHRDFLKSCLTCNIMPKGLDFRVELCTAFEERNINIEDFMKKSKESLLTIIIQHYSNQIPRLQEEIDELNSRLCKISTEIRFCQMRRDLNLFAKRLRQKCNRTKQIKNAKLQKEVRVQAENHADKWITELNLRKRELDVITRNEWLTDEVMDATSALFKAQFPYITGFDNASFAQAGPGFDRNGLEGMQFHCVEGCHWVLSSSIGGRIRVYDSLPSDNLAQDLQRQLREIYSPDGGSISVEQVPVQRQLGSSDCGLFAISFATSILHFQNVSNLVFDQSQLRSHLLQCLQNKKLTPFPLKRSSLESERRGKITPGDWSSPPKSARVKAQPSAPPTVTSNSFQILQENEECTKTLESTATIGTNSPEKRKEKWKKGDLILNLSDATLTGSEMELLKLGIKFCPSPSRVDYFRVFKDVTAFCRRMRLREFFVDAPALPPMPKWKKGMKNSHFNPKNREANLETYLDLVSTETINLLKTNSDEHLKNMDLNKREALEKLKKNKNIILKNADKGGALVILNINHYNEAILQILSNKEYYEEQESDQNLKYTEEVFQLTDEMRKNQLISDDDVSFLNQKNPRTPLFYGLPKIHKIFDSLPQFRPIVSGISSCTEKISCFVDFFLQPLTKLSSSYIKDTTNFLSKVQNIQCKETDILVSADVTGLYTVIDHEEGIAACEDALEERSMEEKNKMPTHYIVELIRLILSSNCFSFLDSFFKQIKGTAMGTPMAPSYANLFMTKIEKEMLSVYEMETGLRPISWMRFLDDIFFLWPHGIKNLQHFQRFMQEFSEKKKMKTKLQFTFEAGNSVPFLDTVISISSNGKLKSDLFSKTTDAHLYLRQDSCHPKSCIKGLVKGEMLRVRRICSEVADYLKRASELKAYFVERGFKSIEVEKTIQEVLVKNREEALKYKEKKKSDRVPYVIQYHPRLRALGKVLHKHFHLLKTNERLKTAFPEPPMVAFKRLPNLGDRLINTKNNEETNEIKKCGTPRCQCCQHFNESDTVHINGKRHHNQKGGSCKTENLVYALKCKKCNLCYIGESQQRLHQRLNGHREAVRRVQRGQKLNEEYVDTGAAIHFGQGDHDFKKDLQVQIVEKGAWKTPGERKERESFWICHFKTMEGGAEGATGLNKTCGIFNPFYGRI